MATRLLKPCPSKLSELPRRIAQLTELNMLSAAEMQQAQRVLLAQLLQESKHTDLLSQLNDLKELHANGVLTVGMLSEAKELLLGSRTDSFDN